MLRVFFYHAREVNHNMRILSTIIGISLALAYTAASAPPPGKGPNKDDGGGKGRGDDVDHRAAQSGPIKLGTSGGSVVDQANGYCCSGTLGSLLEDAYGIQYILSNTHVLASDSVPGGNGLIAQPGNPINQPGYIDVQCQNIPEDYVAELTTWIPLPPGDVGSVDAAIAEVTPSRVDSSGAILGIGTISSTPRDPALDLSVKKSGRTSGVTTGTIKSINATVNVSYSDECAGDEFVTTFTGQIIVSPGKFIKGGDSGSLMVENVGTNPRPIGLLYAGSKRVAIASPVKDVLDEISISLGSSVSFVGIETANDVSTPSSTGFQNATVAGLKRATAAKEANAARLLQVPNAVGHGVGISGGKPVIQILVDGITPEAINEKPVSINGFRVVLLDIGEIVAL